ncbi:MAG: glycosyltransferase [Acidimicrobiaceae bacterium]|nr:glycosyltransferase [Ilumatobacter sp.]MCB9382451.1 glycosyltransferase [Acidimicrobiaceae bacterium]MCO5329759.1 glycosyltransferase [Ilumatobacteraceae bacterium]
METETIQTTAPAARRAITPATTVARTGASLLAGVAVLQAAGNLLFHGAVSRGLPTAQYADLVTLLNVVLLLSVPLGAVQVAVAASRARHPQHDPQRMLRRIGVALAVATLLVMAAAAPVAGFLHLHSVTSVLLVAPALLAAGMAAAWRGLHLGDGRARLVATAIVMSTVVRLALGALLPIWWGMHGALWATLLAEMAGWTWLSIRRPARAARLPGAGATHLAVPVRDGVRSFSAVAGLWLFTGVDALLARHYLAADAADQYVSAGVITRSVLAVPAAVVMASIAAFAASDAAVARRTVRRVALGLTAWAALVVIALAVAGNLVQTVLFGRVIADHALLVGLGAVAGVSGLVTLFTHFHIARRSSRALLTWAGAAVEIAVIAVAHGNPGQVALGSAASLVFAVVIMGASAAAKGGEKELTAPPATALTAPAAHLDQAPAEDAAGTTVLPPWAADDRLWHPADAAVELSVVVPFYNPGPSVGTTVQSIVDLLRAEGIGFEVIAVSDGATDGSEAHVRAVAAPEVHLIVQPVNGGKGSAVQRGFASARGRFIAFIDADGDIDPVHLVDYLHRARQGGDMVFASKRHADSHSESSPFRKLVSLGFMTVTGTLFRLGASDTQTGCKVLRRELVADVLPWMQERRFAMDLELFVVAKRRGFTDLRPAPVHLGERLSGSTVTRAAIVRTLRDTLTIWHRLHVRRAYPVRAVAAPAVPAHVVLAGGSLPTPAVALIAA